MHGAVGTSYDYGPLGAWTLRRRLCALRLRVANLQWLSVSGVPVFVSLSMPVSVWAGTQMRKNLVDLWWREFVQRRPDVHGLDTGVLLNPDGVSVSVSVSVSVFDVGIDFG